MLLVLVDAVLLGLFVAVVLGVVVANSRTLPSRAGDRPDSAACASDAVLGHVYHPFRLIVYSHCISVPGTVVSVKQEGDGDVKIGLAPDPDYQYTVNLGNRLFHHNELVVEIVCAHPAGGAAALKSCANYTNEIVIPLEGQRVTVVGQHVLDTLHGWNEIHPVYTVSPLAPSAVL